MSNYTLIHGGMVIDGTGALPQQASVLIQGNTIIATGPEADAKADLQSDIERIDARGLTVMPGLIDAHVHATFDDAAGHDELFYHRRPGLSAIIAARNVRRMLTAGVTGFFDADSIFELGVDLKEAIQYGVIEGPRMSTGGFALMTSVGGAAGRLIPDQGTIAYARILRSRDELVTEVRRQVKSGVDWIKVHVTGSFSHRRSEGEITTFTMDELRAVCETAHDLGVPVAGHCRSAESVRKACEAGFDMIIHATNMDEAAIEALLKRGAMIVPALTFQANLAEFGGSIQASPLMQDTFRREIETSAEMFHRAFKAGVPMLCGTESGFSVTPYGDWHHREMEVFVKYLGLSPLEAIKCATESGALALRMKDQVGTVTAGRLADLIGVRGDPSKDVSVLGERKNLHFVMLGGRRIDLAREEPERADIPGWRTHDFGRILTQSIVREARKGTARPGS